MLTAAAIALGAVACSGDAGSVTPQRSPGGSPIAAGLASTQPPGQPSPLFQRCRASQLSATVSGIAAGTNNIFYNVILTNHARPCSLTGYPGKIVGVTAAGRHTTLRPGHLTFQERSGQLTGRPADLRRGGRAQMALDTGFACDLPSETRANSFVTLSVRLPGSTHPVQARFQRGGEGSQGTYGVWLPCNDGWVSEFYRAFKPT